MRRITVKEEYVKATGSFIGGIILDYLVEFKKENKFKDFFNINLKSLIEVTMLDISEATLRREIKKLVMAGFLGMETNGKTYCYKINEEFIKTSFIELGVVEDIEEFLEDDDVTDYHGNIYTQTNIFDIEKAREKHEQSNFKNNNINNNTKDKESEEIYELKKYLKEQIDYEHFVIKNSDKEQASMFDKIYRIMLEVISSKSKNIRINGQDLPSEVVKAVFKKVDSDIIDIVIYKIKRLNTEVIYFKNYIITVIYNTYIEEQFHIQNSIYRNFGII